MRQCKAMKKKIGNSWGVGGVIHDPSGTEIPWGWGGSNRKNHPWGVYGYFLEPHFFKFSHLVCFCGWTVIFYGILLYDEECSTLMLADCLGQVQYISVSK